MTTPLHFQKFNDKVRIMNQSHSKELRMTADEARSLHNDLFNILNEIAAMRETSQSPEDLYIAIDAGDNSL